MLRLLLFQHHSGPRRKIDLNMLFLAGAGHAEESLVGCDAAIAAEHYFIAVHYNAVNSSINFHWKIGIGTGRAKVKQKD